MFVSFFLSIQYNHFTPSALYVAGSRMCCSPVHVDFASMQLLCYITRTLFGDGSAAGSITCCACPLLVEPRWCCMHTPTRIACESRSETGSCSVHLTRKRISKSSITSICASFCSNGKRCGSRRPNFWSCVVRVLLSWSRRRGEKYWLRGRRRGMSASREWLRRRGGEWSGA